MLLVSLLSALRRRTYRKIGIEEKHTPLCVISGNRIAVLRGCTREFEIFKSNEKCESLCLETNRNSDIELNSETR